MSVRPGEPPLADQEPARPRAFHPRPVLVEIASALLIVGGAINLLLSVDALLHLSQGGTDIAVLVVITIALSTLTLALGLAVRFGRGWLVTVNVVAVVAFLELLAANPLGIFFGALDVIVVLALVRERPWFEWSARVRADAAGSGPPT